MYRLLCTMTISTFRVRVMELFFEVLGFGLPVSKSTAASFFLNFVGFPASNLESNCRDVFYVMGFKGGCGIVGCSRR